MPQNFSVLKVGSLITALCKLHNLCIDCRESSVVSALDRDDSLNVRTSGGLRIHASGLSFDPEEDRLDALLDGGEFVEEGAQEQRRTRNKDVSSLPIYHYVKHVESMGYKRPSPKKRKSPNK